MERTMLLSFLTKLEAEKLPPIKSLTIYDLKNNDFMNRCISERFCFYFKWFLRYHLKYVYLKNTKASFWFCYEYEKPYLWSIVDEKFVKDLLCLTLEPLNIKDLDKILSTLYTDICQRLKLDLEFERISFN